MRCTRFKKLMAKALCVLIGILFISSGEITNISMQASAESFLLKDNAGKIFNHKEKLNQRDFSCYSVENVVNELFEESAIKKCEYLYNLDESPDFIYVEFEDGGYAIFLKENMEMLEYSVQGVLEYSKTDLIKYYGGPGYYFNKSNNDCFINTVTNGEIHITEELAQEYSREVRDVLKNNSKNVDKANIEYDYSIVEGGSYNDVVSTYEIQTSKSGGEVPKYDDCMFI